MVSLIDMPQILPQQLPRQNDRPAEEAEPATVMIDVRDLDFAYGSNQVLHDVSLDVPPQAVTAFIGPSGCGKTTLLRCINRMNDLIENARITRGAIHLGGIDINAPEVDVVDLRRRVGMVFQKSNPFPKSIYENISYGLRIAGVNKRSQIDEAVERSLVLGARPDCDRKNRRTNSGIEDAIHDRDRDSQHAAGRAGFGLHRILLSRKVDRIRTDFENLYQSR